MINDELIAISAERLLDIGLLQKREGFAIIATLGSQVGDSSRVVTNTKRTLLPIL